MSVHDALRRLLDAGARAFPAARFGVDEAQPAYAFVLPASLLLTQERAPLVSRCAHCGATIR